MQKCPPKKFRLFFLFFSRKSKFDIAGERYTHSYVYRSVFRDGGAKILKIVRRKKTIVLLCDFSVEVARLKLPD